MHRNEDTASPNAAMKRSEDLEIDKLLQIGVRVANIGLREFARDLKQCGAAVIQVDWSPPAVRDPKIAELLAQLGE